MSGKWHGGKGSAPRPANVPKDVWADNWERIFGNKDKDQEYESENPLERPVNPSYRDKQQDLTELNSDGNRDRGRYGEDLND